MKLYSGVPAWLASAGWEIPLAWCFWSAYVFGGSATPNISQAPPFEAAFTAGLALCLTAWLLKDAKHHGIRACYDFDTFVFCTWTVFLPVYLFRTRGFRAFVTLGIFLLLVASASCVGFLVAMPFQTSR